MKGWRPWIKGLASAAIAAFAIGVSLVIVDPMDYNLGDPAARKKLLMVCTINAIIAVAMYLKQSPLPKGTRSNSGRGMVSMVLVLCLISFGAMSISGCQWSRETMLKGVDEYAANVETEMEATKRLMKVWPYRSCQLRAALGARYGSLPKDATDAWEKADELCAKEEPTDCELGTTCGTWFLMSYEVVREAVKQYAPDILGLLPAFL